MGGSGGGGGDADHMMSHVFLYVSLLGVLQDRSHKMSAECDSA